MSDAALPRFSFDTEFDAAGDISFQAPRPKLSYTAGEVEEVRLQAYGEGQRAVQASVKATQAQALSVIAAACGQALPMLAKVAHEHRESSAALALACGRAIADAALDRFPQAPVQAALEALAREIESAPRLIVTAAPDMAADLQTIVEETAHNLGFTGAVQVRADEAMGQAAFSLDFGDGSATFDPEASAARVALALTAALAAEGLHAEPLIPGES
jgi:flagellar assembly protein FliH